MALISILRVSVFLKPVSEVWASHPPPPPPLFLVEFVESFEKCPSITIPLLLLVHKKTAINYVWLPMAEMEIHLIPKWLLSVCIQISPSCLVRDKVFFWFLSLGTRLRGLIWIPTKKYQNSSHFEIRCMHGLQLEQIGLFLQVLPVYFREVAKIGYGLFFLREKP